MLSAPPASARLVTRILFLAAVLIASTASAAPIDYGRDVRPILSNNCFYCHGQDPSHRKGKLRLDTPEGQRKEGVIVAGKPDESELIARILSPHEDEQMPPKDSNKSLTAAQKDILRRWIAEGAHFAGHWAFTPPQRPVVPAAGTGWARNPVDAFIAATHATQKIRPAPEFTRAQLARRAALDLTGLPLPLTELDAFAADTAPDAYERLVDRLLASPRYGEHMAMNWLDVARYADTNGYQMDAYRMNWPWRDWVVRMFNANQPYDQFTIEQLAGDLLPSPTQDQLIATAFNRNHMLNAEGGTIAEENRTKNVFDRVETTSTAYLGLTLACAQCHDHKFDPLTQKDYYSFYALFNQLSEPGGVNKRFVKKLYSDGYDNLYMVESPFITLETPAQKLNWEQATAARVAADEKLEESRPLFHPQFVAWVGEMRANPTLIGERLAHELDRGAVSSAKLDNYRDANTRRLLDVFFADHASAPWAGLKRSADTAKEAEEKILATIPHVMVMRDDKPRETRVLLRGSYETPGERVESAVPAALPPLPPGVRADRLALARWFIDPEHPLMARVTVNRLWQQFFGRGLVKTPEDFGLQGELPSHPELLEWLAVEFRESGWDVKRFLRLIVTSATYRQSSVASQELRERDPDNALLARGPRHRLDSRVLRDQSLLVAGLLVEKIGGPPVMPYQPPGVWEDMSFGKNQYFQGQGTDLYRRSLYTFWRRSVAPTNFFDVPARQVCSVKPLRTSTPLHALTTLNDVTYVEAARVWADKLFPEPGDAARLSVAFRAVAARAPDERELAQLQRTLDQARTHFAARPTEAGKLAAAGDSPRSTALDPVEHAAWTTLCLLLLNLDETQNN